MRKRKAKLPLCSKILLWTNLRSFQGSFGWPHFYIGNWVGEIMGASQVESNQIKHRRHKTETPPPCACTVALCLNRVEGDKTPSTLTGCIELCMWESTILFYFILFSPHRKRGLLIKESRYKKMEIHRMGKISLWVN